MVQLLTLSKIESIYEEYLRKEGSKNAIERYIDKTKWFNASQAGHCYRKHKYKLLDEKAEKPDKKSLFKMRIGDLIHSDVQKALLKYYSDKLIVTEVEIELEELNVRGYLDIAVIDKTIDLKDIKTMAAFSWKRKFGRLENRDPNPSEKYELQVGTYALGLEKKLGLQVDNMDLIYYKKDDSSFKCVNVKKEFKVKAKEYWNEVLSMCKQDLNKLGPGEILGIPFESWECNYCQYKKTCPSPFKKTNK